MTFGLKLARVALRLGSTRTGAGLVHSQLWDGSVLLASLVLAPWRRSSNDTGGNTGVGLNPQKAQSEVWNWDLNPGDSALL